MNFTLGPHCFASMFYIVDGNRIITGQIFILMSEDCPCFPPSITRQYFLIVIARYLDNILSDIK